jgi:hypothetical protein
MAAGESFFDFGCLSSLSYALLISRCPDEVFQTKSAGEQLRTSVLRSAGRMLDSVLELLYPRLELVHQILQRFDCIVANWCHCERFGCAET